MKTSFQDNPIILDPSYTPGFYAELWGVDAKTVKRWFEDRPGVLKLGKESRSGTRTRVEIRIPWSLAVKVYEEKSR